MKNNYLFITAFFLALFISCAEETVPEEESRPNPQTYTIYGVAQKGPFVNGSQIEIYELNDNLNQTGRSFSTEIINNLGQFTLKELELESTMVEIVADGYYYNEIFGLLSPSRLVLKSLADISEDTIVNVNILTHLIIDRVKTLVEDGDDFSTAQSQACTEFLKVFEIGGVPGNFNLLDISKEGAGNGVLIMVSSIFQMGNTVSQLSKLLAEFKADFGDNGIVNDTEILFELAYNAKLIDVAQVQNNIEKLYSNLGVHVETPEFESILSNFIGPIDEPSEGDSLFPAEGIYGLNLLAMKQNQVINSGTSYSLALDFPTDLKLFVEMKVHADSVTWKVDPAKLINWSGVPASGEPVEASVLGELADMPIIISGTGKIGFEFNIYKVGNPNIYLDHKAFELIVK